MKHIAASALILLVLSACNSGSPNAAAPEPGESRGAEQVSGGRFVGHLVWGHEARSFRTCDGSREGWVINDAGEELVEIYESLTYEPYQEMFVEVRGEWQAAPTDGFGADFAEAFRIAELLRAEDEGHGCSLDLEGVLYIATGNEPSWRIVVRADGLSTRTMEAPEGVQFPRPVIDAQAGQVAINTNDPDAAVRIVLERERCEDTMSGAQYSLAAKAEVDGKRYTGCALRGL